jgi:hypothetical protein
MTTETPFSSQFTRTMSNMVPRENTSCLNYIGVEWKTIFSKYCRKVESRSEELRICLFTRWPVNKATRISGCSRDWRSVRPTVWGNCRLRIPFVNCHRRPIHSAMSGTLSASDPKSLHITCKYSSRLRPARDKLGIRIFTSLHSTWQRRRGIPCQKS